MSDLICPKCGARVVEAGSTWRIEASEIFKCLDLRGTKHWFEGDISWCPTLAAEAYKREWIWDGFTYRNDVLAEIEAVQASKAGKDGPPT